MSVTSSHMQKIVNAPATPGEGHRVHAMISALVNAGGIGIPAELLPDAREFGQVAS